MAIFRVGYVDVIQETLSEGKKYHHSYQNQPESHVNVSAANNAEGTILAVLNSNFSTPSGTTRVLKFARNADLQYGTSTPQHGGQVYS